MDDKEYWKEYYSKNFLPTNPSSFAEFVLDYLDEGNSLIELGCGNGRDSLFFYKNKIDVIGVDQVRCEVEFLNENYGDDSLIFLNDDFTNLENAQLENKSVLAEKDLDYIYSRFTFHSINEKKENRTLDWIENNLNTGGLFLLEARSLKDPMYQKGKSLSETENFTDHYRRYMDYNNIIEKLTNRNFEIIFGVEDNDLAVYKDDNPYVIRIIAKKL